GATVGREDPRVLALRRGLTLGGLLRAFRNWQRDEAVVRHAGAAGQQSRECGHNAELTPHLDCRLSPHDPPTLPDDLDLLRNRCFNHRTTALLHPASHSDPVAFQFLRIPVRRREISPMTLENGDREVLCPPPPEIHIYCGAVLPHRQDLALDKGELTPNSRNAGNIV